MFWVLAVWATTFSKVLAESGCEESLILQNKRSGTERIPKGHQKSGRPKFLQQKYDRKRVSVTSAKGGGALGFVGAPLAPLGRFWVSVLAPTGSRRVDPMGVSWCIWRYRKTKNANNYTLKVEEAKYIKKRRADGPSWVCLASLLAAIGFRSAHQLGVSRCTWRCRSK